MLRTTGCSMETKRALLQPSMHHICEHYPPVVGFDGESIQKHVHHYVLFQRLSPGPGAVLTAQDPLHQTAFRLFSKCFDGDTGQDYCYFGFVYARNQRCSRI